MNFDRNTVIGFLLLAVLFFGYFYLLNTEQSEMRIKQAREQFVRDSLAATKAPAVDPQKLKTDSLRADSLERVSQAGTFSPAMDSTTTNVTLETQSVKVRFTSRGGQIGQVELKGFKGLDSGSVTLAGSDGSSFGYPIKTGNGRTSLTTSLQFSLVDSGHTADGSAFIRYRLSGSDSSSSIEHLFVIPKEGYLIRQTIHFKGVESLLDDRTLRSQWNYTAARQEQSISFEKQNTQVGYIEKDEFDYHTIGRSSDRTFDGNVNWVGIRQRFFLGALIAPKPFQKGEIVWSDTSQSNVVAARASLPLSVDEKGEANLQYYYGPSDYHTLKQYGLGLEKIVNLGQGVYSFVSPLNKYVILPMYEFLRGLSGANLGIAILLLTIFIRLLISPLTYTSYLSGAKMKALRPEIAKLKEKFGEDRQAMSMEQMKLFREAGVNPLGGCIPALLQIPIFFALFSFFNSEVSLRGASFLWAHDLSTFDAPIEFGFSIPLLGGHLSLFNVLAALTSFLISWYSMSMTPDQDNPMLKYMPYIFPVFLLFFFNQLPAGLTWYYTVSNLVTLGLQYIIQNYIIDHDKILAKIEENRKKPKVKSKWQERLDQMQEQQKKLNEQRKKH
ncbi:MAG: membrane protein insertase YidC [Bacteroidota bacterium]